MSWAIKLVKFHIGNYFTGFFDGHRNMEKIIRRFQPQVHIAIVAGLLLSGAPIVGATEAEPDPRDPWEPVNRAVFGFNEQVDAWILKPVAKGYKTVTPEPVEGGVSNFFANLNEVPNVLNNMLQWKWGRAGNSAGRFLLNSTIGLAGFVDVAAAAGLPRYEDETFGQTLSSWGAPAGPYLVLPLLGPSTVTDTAGLPLEQLMHPSHYTGDNVARVQFAVAESIDLRARLLKSEDFISGDRYTFIRDAYIQRRAYLVADGEVTDDFGGDIDDFDEFDDF